MIILRNSKAFSGDKEIEYAHQEHKENVAGVSCIEVSKKGSLLVCCAPAVLGCALVPLCPKSSHDVDKGNNENEPPVKRIRLISKNGKSVVGAVSGSHETQASLSNVNRDVPVEHNSDFPRVGAYKADRHISRTDVLPEHIKKAAPTLMTETPSKFGEGRRRM